MADRIETLERLQALRASGALTDAEFGAEKAKLLSIVEAEPISHWIEAPDSEQSEAHLNQSRRTIRIVVWVIWLAMLIALLAKFWSFSLNNWNPVEVKIWPGQILETKLPALLLLSFLLGLAPLLLKTKAWVAWVALLFVMPIFALNNWIPVEVQLWDGLILETKLPGLMFATLLLGFIFGLVPFALGGNAAKRALEITP